MHAISATAIGTSAMWQNLNQLIRGNTLHEVLIEVAIIWICVYGIIRFLRGTRGASIFKGVLLLFLTLTLAIRVLGEGIDALDRLKFIYDKLLAALTIPPITVFPPEPRQAMIPLGRPRFFGGSPASSTALLEAVADAAVFLSRSQFGALIAIERQTQLGTLIDGGQPLDAHVSTRLLESIFWPNSPLHDLGVIIREDRIVAANVLFPVADDAVLPRPYGSRHRAAIGLTLESDAIVVVVSEETGTISIVERGEIETRIPHDRFRDVLLQRFGVSPSDAGSPTREPTPDPSTATALGASIAKEGT